MKPGWKRDIILGIICVLFVITSLHVLRDWEKAQMRKFLETGKWQAVPLSQNVEYR